MTDNPIDVDAVHDALIERRRVNSIDILEAVFVRDGKVLNITHAQRQEFRFTGLANVNFVASNFDLGEAKRCSNMTHS